MYLLFYIGVFACAGSLAMAWKGIEDLSNND